MNIQKHTKQIFDWVEGMGYETHLNEFIHKWAKYILNQLLFSVVLGLSVHEFCQIFFHRGRSIAWFCLPPANLLCHVNTK